jgi:hypothetical protein
MEAVAAYALSTQSGPKPLYLTSFDIQPGNAFSYRGSADRALGAFLAALRTASPTVDEARTAGWVKDLGPALACKAEGSGAGAVEEIGRWIEQDVAPALARSRPAVHVRALRLAPRMMRSRLTHCREVATSGRRVYQAARDRLNAELVQAMLTSEPRLVLWAHHSHVHHNSQGAAADSMGQHLKAALGGGLYTIGVFANGGSAIDSLAADESEDGLAPRPVPRGPRFGMEWRLAGLSTSDLFVDLRRAPEAWSRPMTSRLEVQGRMATAPVADFDGAVLLHEVSAPWLTFLPRPARGRGGRALRPGDHRRLVEPCSFCALRGRGFNRTLPRPGVRHDPSPRCSPDLHGRRGRPARRLRPAHLDPAPVRGGRRPPRPGRVGGGRRGLRLAHEFRHGEVAGLRSAVPRRRRQRQLHALAGPAGDGHALPGALRPVGRRPDAGPHRRRRRRRPSGPRATTSPPRPTSAGTRRAA